MWLLRLLGGQGGALTGLKGELKKGFRAILGGRRALGLESSGFRGFGLHGSETLNPKP